MSSEPAMRETHDEAAMDLEATVHASNPNASGPQRLAGSMGVSSERTGPAGPGGEEATDGTRPTNPPPLPDDTPPEQEPGNPEENPLGIPPKRHQPERNPGHSHS